MENTKLDQYIKQLAEIADAPGKACYDLKASGKNLVGWVAPYAPEEIVYAAGAIPVGLWGGQVELKKARTYLPPFACSIMQSIMEGEATGVYDILSAVLIPAPCDTLKCFGQKWKGSCPAIPFVHPQNRKLDCAVDFLAGQYEMIRKKLEEILSVEITDEALADAIAVYNDCRYAVREFTEVAADYPQIITPTVRHQILKAAMFMDKKDYTVIIKGITHELRKMKPQEWGGKKVIVTGITLEPTDLLQIFEEFSVAVVGDDLAQESRQFRTDVVYYGSPTRRLAKQWQNHSACSLAFDPYKERVSYLSRLARATKADGVIIALMKFCDPEEYDVPIIMEEMEKEGIPLLTIEIDQQSNSYEQIKTRIQSFVESME